MNLPENVVCTKNADQELIKILDAHDGKIFVLADDNTATLCLPLLPSLSQRGAVVIVIQSGEQHKNITII